MTEIILEDLAVEKTTLAAVISGLPTIALDPGVANPRFADAAIGRLFDPRDIGLRCAAGSRRTLALWYSDALSSDAPEDQAAIARFRKLEAAHSICYDAYVQKHDRSGDWEVLRIDRDGSIVNLNDEISRKAHEHCGAAKASRAADALIAAANKSAAARHRKAQARLEQRFARVIE